MDRLAMREQRKDEWRARKEQHINNRRKKLNELFKDDLEVDNLALKRDWIPKKGVVKSSRLNPYRGQPMFDSHSMDGSSGYILGETSKYLKTYLTRSSLEYIQGRVKDQDWIKKELEDFGDDNLVPKEGTGLFKLNAISHNYAFVEQYSEPKLWQQIVNASKFIKKIRLLRRLVDNRNPGLDMNVEPTANALSIQNNHLRTSWVLHRAWIRALHYRSLTIGEETFGVDQMQQIMLLSLGFLQLECDNWGFEPVDKQQNPVEFNDFACYYHKIEEALENIGNELTTERRSAPASGVYTMDETIAYNMFPERLVETLRRHMDPLGAQWSLWSALLQYSDRFERYLDIEHVEDVMINKRVVYDDEWSQIFDLLISEGYYPAEILLQPAYIGDGSDPLLGIESILRKISQINRLRQSYLVLRDWMKRRPWKQLYFIYDTREGAQAYLVPHIQAFHQSLAALKNEYPMPEKQHIPTNKANMFSCLTPVHPLANTELPDFLTKDGLCVICLETWAEKTHTLIVKLHCNHSFHYHCIRDHWDIPECLTLRCPHCRSQNHPWHLHDVAGIVPEVLDVWDYERVDPQQPDGSRTNDSLSDNYFDLENDKLEASRRYTDVVGYGIVPTNTLSVNGGERSADVEMAVARWARRKKNEYRTNLRRHLGESIQVFNPEFERPPEPPIFPPPPGPDMISPEGPGGEYEYEDEDESESEQTEVEWEEDFEEEGSEEEGGGDGEEMEYVEGGDGYEEGDMEEIDYMDEDE